MFVACNAVRQHIKTTRVNNIKGWASWWKHNLCDAVVCSAFRRHIDAQLFWSISPSEQRPSLSLRPGACEKWGREETMHFNLSVVLYLEGRVRRWEQKRWALERERCIFNPVSASQTLLLAIRHNIGSLQMPYLQAGAYWLWKKQRVRSTRGRIHRETWNLK